MIITTFDTHEFVKELKEAGFSEQQAEAITKLQKSTVNATLEHAKHDYQLDDLATKRDLKELEVGLKRDIELTNRGVKELELKVAKDIAESKAEMIRWVVGVGLLQTTLITGVLLKLAHLI